ncbi:MAG: VCBS repeat-containing protein, partial [Deltaproteobacteria bacterium]|nr:VCBS repeat-containing protein [Deltaproteobacteria bacterium]
DCVYDHTDTTCPQGCAGGACTGDPCLGVVCDDPPDDECVDAQTLRSYGQGRCVDGDCIYDAYTDATCPNGCDGGACTGDPCLGVVCNDPPPNECIDVSTLRSYGQGRCVDGGCIYDAYTDTTCPNGCAGGACTGDPCLGVQCDNPPADECVGASTLRSYGQGRCVDGGCIYDAYTDTVCEHGCESGACVDPCQGVDCSTPPDAECSDVIHLRSWSNGRCVEGLCEYDQSEDACPAFCGQRDGADVCVALVDHSQLLGANQRSTSDVQIADVDGDGDPDIVWISQTDYHDNPGGIDLTLNEGGGSFSAGDTSAVAGIGSWHFGLAVDVDGDLDRDLVLSRAATTSQEMLLLVNDGAGGFSEAATPLPSVTGQDDGYCFGRVCAADFDGLGGTDIFLPIAFNVDFGSDRANVLLLNQGDGTFVRDDSRLPSMAAHSDYTFSAAAGDLDGDSDADIYLGESERQQRLLVNDGQGATFAFTEEGTSRLPANALRAYNSELVDLDGDGDLDVAVVNDTYYSGGGYTAMGNHIFVNDGTGHFSAQDIPLTVSAHDGRGLAWGDLNADGVADLVIGNGHETLPHGGTAIEVLLGQSAGAIDLLPLSGLPAYDKGVFGVAVGDLNGDGFGDIAAAVAELDGALDNILLLTEIQTP